MEGRTMKKIIIILSVLLALSLAGVLYATQEQSDERTVVSVEEAYTAQFPGQLPNVIMDPMVGFPVY